MLYSSIKHLKMAIGSSSRKSQINQLEELFKVLLLFL
jgi:hypothetical protein